MEERKPMGIGRLLDHSFQLFRTHFASLFILMLVLVGPLYLLQSFLILDFGGAGLLPRYEGGSFLERLEQSLVAEEEFGVGIGRILLAVLVVLPLIFFVAMPMAATSVLLLIKNAYEGKQAAAGELMIQAFRRFWAVVGSSALYVLIAFGLYMGFIFSALILVGIIGVTGGLVGQALDLSGNPAAIGALIVVIAAVVGSGLLGMAYLLLRLGFYLPASALERQSPGLARSWELTRRSFWRLFTVFLILGLVYSVISGGFYLLIMAVLQASILGQLLQTLFYLLLLPLLFVAYGAAYFDMKLRTEGDDLAGRLGLVPPGGGEDRLER